MLIPFMGEDRGGYMAENEQSNGGGPASEAEQAAATQYVLNPALPSIIRVRPASARSPGVAYKIDANQPDQLAAITASATAAIDYALEHGESSGRRSTKDLIADIAAERANQEGFGIIANGVVVAVDSSLADLFVAKGGEHRRYNALDLVVSSRQTNGMEPGRPLETIVYAAR